MFAKLKALSVLGAGLYLAGATYAAAQQADLNSPDLVVINAKVLTMDAGSSVAEAIAIRDGKILAVGSSASIKALIGAQTRVFDVAGKTVVPGLIDTHAHFKAAGMTDYVVNMSRAKTVAEALDAIKAFAAKKKPGEWIVGGPWHPPSQLAEKRYTRRRGNEDQHRRGPGAGRGRVICLLCLGKTRSSIWRANGRDPHRRPWICDAHRISHRIALGHR